MPPARALVTGGAGTLGQALAAQLLARGTHVVLTDLDEDALEAVRARLGHPAGLTTRVLDVTCERAWWDLAAICEATGTPIDLLVNNACLPSARRNLIAIDAAHWSSVIDVGLTGAFLGIRAFVPAMIIREHGRVLNIASLAGLGSCPQHGDYAAAKAALISVSETLRDELVDTGVRVAVACPGPIGRPVGHARQDGESDRAAGRMDPASGMAHVLDAMSAGTFYILTHSGSSEALAARTRSLRDAMACAPGDARSPAGES